MKKAREIGLSTRKLCGIFPLFFLSMMGALNAIAQEVIPDFYRDPGLYPNRSYINQSFNEYIDPFTGSLQHHYVDIHVPGNGGFDLKIVRSYNSASVDPTDPSASESLAGVGWKIHFGRVLKSRDLDVCENKNAQSVADNPVLELTDGSRQLLAFTDSGSPRMLTTQRWRADCPAGRGVVVYSPDGTRYDMTHLVVAGSDLHPTYAWHTTKITDRNGNYADVRYDALFSPQIATISTNDGRTISFSYADSGSRSRRISSITSFGQTYRYEYEAVPSFSGLYFLTSVIRPDGSRWTYRYNGNLKPSPGSYVMGQSTHPKGGSVSYSYGLVNFDDGSNPDSQLTTVVMSKSRSAGGNWSFSYVPGSLGNYDTTTVTTPSGTITYKHIGPQYSMSGITWMVGLLVSKSIGTNQTETYTWGKQKISSENYFRPGYFLTKIDAGETNAPVMTKRTISRDGAFYTTEYRNYDSYGNPGTIYESGTPGAYRTTNFSYFTDPSKWIIKLVKSESAPGMSVDRSFDGNGNLTSISRDGVVTSYTYDIEGNVASVICPRSIRHVYSGYKRGIPQYEVQSEDVSISRVVSDAGNVVSETNAEGKTTTYLYDGLNRVTSISHPIGSPVSVAYGATSKTTTRGDLKEITTYNNFGDVITLSLGGISRTFTVDPLGRKTFESDPGVKTGTSFQYDMLNRPIKIVNADGTAQSISFLRDTKKIVDERGKATTFIYRAYGSPDQQFLMGISASDASANIAIARNSRDLITSVTQAGVTRNYGYNSKYHLTSVTNPETGITTYGRDDAGNMTTSAVGASGITHYTYDGHNRLIRTTYPGSTPSVTQTYNKMHKLLTAKSASGNRSFSYDANGNMLLESLEIDGLMFTAAYAYNSLDQLSAMTYPVSGMTVAYAPDLLGRPSQVSGFISNVIYWPSGQVKQISYVNGTVTQYQQNARLWPSLFSTLNAAGTRYINSTYSYDGVGNLIAISDSVDTRNNRILKYDNINRLTGINGPWGLGTISYNGAGNIISQILGTSTLHYSYDSRNRLSSVLGMRTASYAYDTYGNIISGAGNIYTYDDKPNLRCVNCINNAYKIEYDYDGLNHRALVVKAGKKTYEMVSATGHQLLAFTPDDGNRLVEYLYLGNKRIAQRVSP